MKKRKGNALLYVLVAICVAIYVFFFGEKEAPFVPYYYTDDGRDIYYQSKRDQKFSDQDHYVLAVTQIPHSAWSPRDKPSEPFGDEAKKFVRESLRSRDIYLERLGNSSYVYVWLDALGASSDVKGIEYRMLNAQLISRGYSKYLPSRAPYGETIKPEYERVFLELQESAQKRRAGIWSLPENSPEEMAKREKQRLLEEKQAAEEERKERLAQEREKKKQQQEYLRKANAVVITSRGKKYHDPSCSTVGRNYKTITIKQALKRGYKPCGVCEPPEQEVTLANCGIDWDEEISVYLGEKQVILKE